RTMVDEETPADLRAWMNLDARQKARDLRDDARNQWNTGCIELMGQPVEQGRMKAGVTEDNFDHTFRRRIFPENRVDLFSNGPKHGILLIVLDDHRPRTAASLFYTWN